MADQGGAWSGCPNWYAYVPFLPKVQFMRVAFEFSAGRRQSRTYSGSFLCPHARRLGIELLEDRRLLCVVPWSTQPTEDLGSDLSASADITASDGNEGVPPPSADEGQAALNRLIVRFSETIRPQSAAHVASAAVGTVVRELPLIHGAVVEFDHTQTEISEALAAWNADPSVLYAEPDFEVNLLETVPDDPRFSDMWGLNNTGQNGGTPDADIDAPEAWDTFTGSSHFCGLDPFSIVMTRILFFTQATGKIL